MKLSLGVMDGPHWSPDDSAPTSIYEVAKELEVDYGIMEDFVLTQGQMMADALARSVVDSFELLNEEGVNLFALGTYDIQQEFKTTLDEQRLDYHIAGVPTKRSIEGYVMGIKTGQPRPSFIDSGDYVNAFAAKVIK